MKGNNYNLSLQIFDDIDFFTPVQEALINSIVADASEVTVSLEKSDEKDDLFSSKISSITISDDGHGFNEDCQDSFDNLAESNKKNCKGLGRLSFLQVFSKIEIDSTFKSKDEKFQTLKFLFHDNFTEIDRNQNIKPTTQSKAGTSITFEGIKQEFINHLDNKCDAVYCFSKIIHYVLPHLCFHECKLIIKAAGQQQEFDLKGVKWINWKDGEKIEINNSEFKIRYHQYQTESDKADDNYFLYLAKDRAVRNIFSKGITNFRIGDNKKLIVVVSSDALDSKVSVDWKRFKIRRDYWLNISSRIKKEIGELVSNLAGDNMVDYNLSDAKKDRPDLARAIDAIANEEKWMAIEGKSAVIEKAEKMHNKSVSNLMKSKGNTADLNSVRESALMQLTMTRHEDLSKAVEICNDPNVNEEKIHNLLYTQKTDSNSEEINRLWLLDARWQYAEYISSENTILEMLGLNAAEKDMNSLEIFFKHGIDLSEISEKLLDANFKKEFNKRPDIAIFNDDSVVIIELKKPEVDLINHTEKIKYYASLIAFVSKNKQQKYKRFYCYLIGSKLPILNRPYFLTADRKGYFYTDDLAMRKRNIRNEIEEELTNSKIYYEICEYDKFLKDCYLQHLEFFRAIGKKIEKLENFLPEKLRKIE